MKSRLVVFSVVLVLLALQPEVTYSESLVSPTTVVTRQVRANGAVYERILVHGDALEGNLEGDSPDRTVSVYLPPSYSTARWRRYPVLYLLHGFSDSDDRWFGLTGAHFVNVPDAADRAFTTGSKEM